MAAEKDEKPKIPCVLDPINLNDPYQFGELSRQRAACGWHFEPEKIESWRKAIDAKTKALFWINLRKPTAGALNEECVDNRVGHISLDSDKDPPDDRLAKPDKSVLEISSLYVLPEYRRLGLASAAVKQLESRAKIEPYGSPDCKAITVNTVSRRYLRDEGEECQRIRLARALMPRDLGFSTEEWYERLGYVTFQEEYVYQEKLLDGTEVKLLAALMRKEI